MAYFVALIKAYPAIPWIGIGTASGQVFAAKRKSDGTIVARTRFNSSDCYSEYNLDAAGVTFDPNSFVRDVSCTYDPRVRGWYLPFVTSALVVIALFFYKVHRWKHLPRTGVG